MNKFIKIESESDIPAIYRETPIGSLLRYHNLHDEFKQYKSAQMLIGMCMDNRKHLDIPDNFAFIIRTGGANMRHSEFKLSFAIGVGGVKHIALIGHSNCGMVDLISKKETFVNGLVNNAGWTKEAAEEHFQKFAPTFEIGNAAEFILSESARLRMLYPKIQIAPLMYLVEDNLLYFIEE